MKIIYYILFAAFLFGGGGDSFAEERVALRSSITDQYEALGISVPQNFDETLLSAMMNDFIKTGPTNNFKNDIYQAFFTEVGERAKRYKNMQLEAAFDRAISSTAGSDCFTDFIKEEFKGNANIWRGANDKTPFQILSRLKEFYVFAPKMGHLSAVEVNKRLDQGTVTIASEIAKYFLKKLSDPAQLTKCQQNYLKHKDPDERCWGEAVRDRGWFEGEGSYNAQILRKADSCFEKLYKESYVTYNNEYFTPFELDKISADSGSMATRRLAFFGDDNKSVLLKKMQESPDVKNSAPLDLKYKLAGVDLKIPESSIAPYKDFINSRINEQDKKEAICQEVYYNFLGGTEGGDSNTFNNQCQEILKSITFNVRQSNGNPSISVGFKIPGVDNNWCEFLNVYWSKLNGDQKQEPSPVERMENFINACKVFVSQNNFPATQYTSLEYQLKIPYNTYPQEKASIPPQPEETGLFGSFFGSFFG